LGTHDHKTTDTCRVSPGYGVQQTVNRTKGHSRYHSSMAFTRRGSFFVVGSGRALLTFRGRITLLNIFIPTLPWLIGIRRRLCWFGTTRCWLFLRLTFHDRTPCGVAFLRTTFSCQPCIGYIGIARRHSMLWFSWYLNYLLRCHATIIPDASSESCGCRLFQT